MVTLQVEIIDTPALSHLLTCVCGTPVHFLAVYMLFLSTDMIHTLWTEKLCLPKREMMLWDAGLSNVMSRLQEGLHATTLSLRAETIFPLKLPLNNPYFL